MRRARTAGLWALVVVIAFTAYRVLGVYQFRPGDCVPPPPRTRAETYPHRLLVMTYNIEGHAELLKGDAHLRDIAAVIRRHHPDIVAINEAHRFTWQARFDDQVNRLAQLTGMNAAFGASYTFLHGGFGNAVLSRGTIVSTEVHHLPGVGEPRSVLEATIRIDGATMEMWIAHTSAWASLNRGSRQTQLNCINATVRTSAFPYVVTGDLNAPPDSPEIRRFLRDGAFQFAGDPSVPSHKLMNQRLDYILPDHGWTVGKVEVLDEGPSDHRPVIAELTHS